ncbi:MAG: heavy metal-associated domain-containing protein, partial [Nanoarchaeota archaeon]|nr:heavy metal-associated domain-containing protein [Nanoarchaeota archaeon]
MKRLNVNVKGMTCSSCEVLIERGLKKVPGVEKVSVNRAREEAEIQCADPITLEQLQDAVKDKGYRLSLQDSTTQKSPSNFFTKNADHYMEIGAIFLLLVGVYLLLKQLNLIPEGIGVTDNMSYGFIFIIGLVAAMSTCLAVAGGL